MMSGKVRSLNAFLLFLKAMEFWGTVNLVWPLLPNSDQSPPAQLKVTLYTNNRSFLLVELNAGENCSPWRKTPPVLRCRQSKSRVQPENGFPSMLYIQWEASRQQDKLFVAICDLKETNCIILYQLKHFWDIHLLQKTGSTLKQAFTHV